MRDLKIFLRLLVLFVVIPLYLILFSAASIEKTIILFLIFLVIQLGAIIVELRDLEDSSRESPWFDVVGDKFNRPDMYPIIGMYYGKDSKCLSLATLNQVNKLEKDIKELREQITNIKRGTS